MTERSNVRTISFLVLVRRWVRFNLAGLSGLALQLAVLRLLIGGLDLALPVSTVLAVECAILNNFVWHHRATWADRPCTGLRQITGRLLRYHAACGVVSLAGASALTWMLTRLWDGHYLAANIAATAACSVLNFAACDRLAFRPAGEMEQAVMEAGGVS